MTNPHFDRTKLPIVANSNCRTLHRLPYEEEAHVRPDICE
jgi:hypothetical protein